MRRILVVFLALATLTLMALPGTAKKGGIPGPPDKPDDPPPVSVTCVSPWWADYETDDFDIVLTGDQPDSCVDVLTDTEGLWVATVTRGPDTIWRRPELMMVPRDAAWPSDSCGGIKRVGESVFDQDWVFPPADDPRGFTTIPAATVNACPGWDAMPAGGNGIGEWGELVEYEFGDPVKEYKATGELHPLAFVVWSHNLRKGEIVFIHIDLPPLGD